MHSCFCMLVIVSVFISMSSAAELNVFDTIESVVVQEAQSIPKSDEGKRRKRFIYSADRTNIVDKMNSLRRTVGASNMNYLTYSNSLEVDVANWTTYCNYDATFHPLSTEAVLIKYVSGDEPDHVSFLEEVFKDPTFYNLFRSIHLRYVGADSNYCYTIRGKDRSYSSAYLTGYAFSHTSYYNENLTQFTQGEECTTCLSGSYWCDGGLCRDDCSSQKSSCSCYTSCTKCNDWNRGSCKCPSLPFADAATLNCSSRATGGLTNKAASCRPSIIASWVMIVLSTTLALFGLQ